MKKNYGVFYTNNVESKAVFTTENETVAREFFEKEKRTLSTNTSVDVSVWDDNDQAWQYVYFVELIEMDIDDEGEIFDVERVDRTEYYYL